MRPVLIDTNAYADFMRGRDDIVEIVRNAQRLYLNSIVLGELLAGFAAGNQEARNRAGLTRFLDSPRVTVVPITGGTADRYALCYIALRRAGTPIPTNDLWIAASALEHGADVLTRDARFATIPGLRAGHRLDQLLP